MPSREAMAVGRWLQRRRDLVGKSQRELSTETGVAVRTISRWEAGVSVEHVVTVLKVLSALGYDLEAEPGVLPVSVSAELASLRRELREALVTSTREIEAALARG